MTNASKPKEIIMTTEELINIVRNRNGKPRFDWQGWFKVFLMLLLPGIAMITYITTIDGNLANVTKDVERHQEWLVSLKESFHQVENSQGIIVEKITRAQKDIEQLLQKSNE